MKSHYIVFIALLSLSACKTPPAVQSNLPEITGVDFSLNPGDDFYRYANGKWYDSVSIPASQAGVGAYMFMNYPQRLRLQGILDSISLGKYPEGSIEQKVGARGLRSILEKNLQEIQFILPRLAKEGVSRVFVDAQGGVKHVYKPTKKRANDQ